MWRPGFNPWVVKIPWRRERLPTPAFWPGEFHGLYSPRGHRVRHDRVIFTSLQGTKRLPCWCRATESPFSAGDAGSILWSRRFLEEEKATNFNILAWKIPWTEELGGLQYRVTKSQTWLSNQVQQHKELRYHMQCGMSQTNYIKVYVHTHTHTQKLVPNCESLEDHLFGQYERKSSTDNTHNNKNWEADVLTYNEKLLSQL